MVIERQPISAGPPAPVIEVEKKRTRMPKSEEDKGGQFHIVFSITKQISYNVKINQPVAFLAPVPETEKTMEKPEKKKKIAKNNKGGQFYI